MALSLREFPWYAQVGAFVAVSSLAVGGFYYWYAEPMRVEIESRQATLNQLRAEIEKGEATARRLPEFQAEVSALQERLDDLRAVLPEQKDVGDLLRRLQTLATQSNLTILGFKPQPIATQELHAEWPIILELEGTYHDLGFFFDRISRFSRIINISDLQITAKPEPEGDATITAQCRATTFVLLETPADADPATGETAPAETSVGGGPE